MTAVWMVCAASLVVIIWGVAHVVPTRAVVRSFGPISADSTRIITMEWVAEGLALTSIGVLTLVLALGVGSGDPTAILVYRCAAAALLVFALWTLYAGFKTAIIPIKICPLVLSTAAALLIAATLV